MKKHYLKRSCLTIAIAALSTAAYAQQAKISDDVVKIGVITDMTGNYSDFAGQGAVTAVKMAIEDFGGKVLGKPIELVVADHLNKADIGAAKAREWFDTQKVDMITELTNSSVALAVVKLAKEKNRIAIVNGALTAKITNEDCTPNSIHYVTDTYGLAKGTGEAVVAQGGNTWYLLAADYAFGALMSEQLTQVVTASGGKVVGGLKHPLGTPDFSSFLLQAQSSGAKVIGLANGGVDLVNTMKTANEFGIPQSGKHTLIGLATVITDIHAMGLKNAQGLTLTTAFYWDADEQTRKWSKRYFERMKKMPNMIHAGNYSSTMHYLNAIKAAGTDDAQAVMAKMREMPINDFFAKNGRIREDGKMVNDLYLMQVKTPAESKYPWDYYKLKAVIPASSVTLPAAQSKCALLPKS